MFLALATECGIPRPTADDIWHGGRVDLLDLKHQSLEKLKQQNMNHLEKLMQSTPASKAADLLHRSLTNQSGPVSASGKPSRAVREAHHQVLKEKGND